MENWLLDNGAKFPKLVLKDYGNEMRACHSNEAVEDEEIIVDIPLNCLITVEMGKDTPVGKLIMSSNLDLDAPKHIFLMLYMLIDRKNPDSFFKPYYDVLPPTLHNMPIFWDKDELRYMEGSYLLSQIDERNHAIESDYEAICQLDPTFANVCTVDEFKWARMCVCSRNFGLIVNGMRTAALVPYADMLNHFRPRETKWQFDDSSQSFTVTAIQTIGAGLEVYDSYGQKCNHRFLLNYGFSVENNEEPDGFNPNEVPILLQLQPDDPLYEEKLALWRRESTSFYRRVRVCISDNENTRLMLALLRIIEADREELSMLMRSPDGSNGGYRSVYNAHTPVSVRSELKVLATLQNICQSYLEKYPTTLENDCVALATGNIPLFSNERNALIQVKGEKEVLHFFLEFAQTGTRLLYMKAGSGEFEAGLEEVRKSKHQVIHQYCRTVLQRLRQEDSRRQEFRERNVDMSRPTIV
jgi:histone-lysine N-methyltransferase SETD3